MDIWVISFIYSGDACKYRITKGSHTNTSISNIYKYCFRGFVKVNEYNMQRGRSDINNI